MKINEVPLFRSCAFYFVHFFSSFFIAFSFSLPSAIRCTFFLHIRLLFFKPISNPQSLFKPVNCKSKRVDSMLLRNSLEIVLYTIMDNWTATLRGFGLDFAGELEIGGCMLAILSTALSPYIRVCVWCCAWYRNGCRLLSISLSPKQHLHIVFVAL